MPNSGPFLTSTRTRIPPKMVAGTGWFMLLNPLPMWHMQLPADGLKLPWGRLIEPRVFRQKILHMHKLSHAKQHLTRIRKPAQDRGTSRQQAVTTCRGYLRGLDVASGICHSIRRRAWMIKVKMSTNV